MTKKQLEQWKRDSIQQAIARFEGIELVEWAAYVSNKGN